MELVRNRLTKMWTALVTVLLCLTVVPSTLGHGRLIDPPSRSSMWRYGFKNSPPNYNDMELFCGGFSRQWGRNGGKCGICGDPWDAARPNEAGGEYFTGVVVRTYAQGTQITATVQLTANHKGYFQFRICPAPEDASVEVTQECLDTNILSLSDGSGNKYVVPHTGNGMFNVALQLPPHLTCDRCVFQWIYVAGNNWGNCEDGTQKVGCGQQEQFRGCADVKIIGDGMNFVNTDISNHETVRPNVFHATQARPTYGNGAETTTVPPPSWEYDVTSRRPVTSVINRRRRPSRRRTTTTTEATPENDWEHELTYKQSPVRPPNRLPWQPEVTAEPECVATGSWADVPGITEWCMTNCFHVPSYCPTSHCRCSP